MSINILSVIIQVKMTCNTFGEIIFKNEVVMWDLLLLSALLERANHIHLWLLDDNL